MPPGSRQLTAAHSRAPSLRLVLTHLVASLCAADVPLQDLSVGARNRWTARVANGTAGRQRSAEAPVSALVSGDFGLRSGRDTRFSPRPSLPDRPAYLMKDARGVVLCRQGAEPAQPGPELLAETGVGARSIGSGASSSGSPTSRGHPDRFGIQRLLLESQPGQALRAAVQRPLKDDKSYPYIKITMADDFPRIERTRKLPNDGVATFGPYASATSVDETDEPDPAAISLPDVHSRHQGRAGPSSDRALLYHIKRCQGGRAKRPLEGRPTGRHRAVEPFLEGARRPWSRPSI